MKFFKWLLGIFFIYKACEFLFYAYLRLSGKMKAEIPIDTLLFGSIGLVFCIIIMLCLLLSSPDRKCPKCKSNNIKLDSVKTIDRWLGKTKVREKMASGKIRERYMQCTMIKKQYIYCCKNPNCQHKFTEVREEEL